MSTRYSFIDPWYHPWLTIRYRDAFDVMMVLFAETMVVNLATFSADQKVLDKVKSTVK